MFPARAGMSPTRLSTGKLSSSVPRASGDEPGVHDVPHGDS